MIRTVITPEKRDVTINIPAGYIGRKVEVLIYALDKVNADENLNRKKPSDFRGKLNLTNEQYEDFQSHLKNVRNEWHNNI